MWMPGPAKPMPSPASAYAYADSYPYANTDSNSDTTSLQSDLWTSRNMQHLLADGHSLLRVQGGLLW